MGRRKARDSMLQQRLWRPAQRAARALAAACLTATSLPDCRFGLLAAAMWGTWAWKLVPHATLLDNAQSVAGLVAIVAVSLLWPTVHPASFQRRRTLALASLRLFLLCLPFNFSQRVLDLALPQQLESGRLAPLVNLSHLISASHLDFLLFTGLGWRLPLRPHMALQGLKLAILARFGVHAHCRGMLLSSPEVQQLAARAHGVMSIAAGALAPGATTALLEPREPYMQVVALLLLAWVLLGWLVPTLLLLPPAAPAAVGEAAAQAAAMADASVDASEPSSSSSERRQQASGSGCELQQQPSNTQPDTSGTAAAGAKPASRLLSSAAAAGDQLASAIEARLRSLSWQPQPSQRPCSEPSLPVPVAWLGTVSCAWIVCCCLAQLYTSAA